jgi:sugar transferase (PEP-CTERM/EpsH1 system associated)
MRILVVTTELPYPPNWGAAMRNYNFLQRLCSSGHQVWLLSYDLPSGSAGAEGLRELNLEARIVPWKVPPSKRFTQLASLVSPRSYTGQIFHQPRMQEEIDRLLAEVDLDLVLVEGSMLWRLDFGTRTPVVLDEHNVEYEMLWRTYVSERSPLRKAFAFLEYRSFKREEQAAWRGASRCVFTSERERDIVRGLGIPTPATAIPNGVDLEKLHPSESTADPNSIVFTGRIGYRPNTDAIGYFVREILPIIHRARPDAVFTVVGADVPPEVRRLAGPRVVVTGAVPDVRPYWRRAAAVVVPMRFGGGTRIKVLEALAMARPVVSTSLGCEGIELVPGEHLLVADTPERFAQSVLRVMDDPAFGTELGARGRSLVQAKYAWSGFAAQMEAVLESAARESTAGRRL